MALGLGEPRTCRVRSQLDLGLRLSTVAGAHLGNGAVQASPAAVVDLCGAGRRHPQLPHRRVRDSAFTRSGRSRSHCALRSPTRLGQRRAIPGLVGLGRQGPRWRPATRKSSQRSGHSHRRRRTSRSRQPRAGSRNLRCPPAPQVIIEVPCREVRFSLILRKQTGLPDTASGKSRASVLLPVWGFLSQPSASKSRRRDLHATSTPRSASHRSMAQQREWLPLSSPLRSGPISVQEMTPYECQEMTGV
jgi:hypothetical protein